VGGLGGVVCGLGGGGGVGGVGCWFGGGFGFFWGVVVVGGRGEQNGDWLP